MASLLSWERGLKSKQVNTFVDLFAVAPLVGAWIEISSMFGSFSGFQVAPLVGAWIEIRQSVTICIRQLSLLSWERGLKSSGAGFFILAFVAPLVGAWIEIYYFVWCSSCNFGRSSRGSVD